MWSVHLWFSDPNVFFRWDTFEDTAMKVIFSLEGVFESGHMNDLAF